jgi:hypothetical protein
MPGLALDPMAEQVERGRLPLRPPIQRVELDQAQAMALGQALRQPTLARPRGTENNDAPHLVRTVASRREPA